MALPLNNPRKKPRDDKSLPISSHPVAKATPWNNPITNPGVRKSTADKWQGKPVSPEMPQQVVADRAHHTRWNAGFANNGWSSTFSDSPGGTPQIHAASALNGLVGQPNTNAQPSVSPLTNPRATNPGAPVSADDPALSSQQVDAGPLKLRSPVQGPPTGGTDSGALTPYGGRMIDNVAVFSDGSNGIPSTVSAEQMKAAGTALNTVPDAAFARPSASAVLGYMPSTEEMVQRRIDGTSPVAGGPAQQLVNPAQQARADQAWEQMGRQSDLAAIANGDWRSPLGTAASNLRLGMRTGTTRERRNAGKALGRLQQATAQGHTTAAKELGATGRTGMAQAGQTRRTGMAQTGANQRAVLNQPGGQFKVLGNNTLALANPKTGQVQLARGPDGQPVLMPGTARARPNESAYQKYRDGLVTQLLHLDPNGQIADPNVEGGFRSPNMADYAAAQQKATALADMNYGRQVSQPMWTLLAKARNPQATPQQLASEYAQYAQQFQR